MIALNCLQYSGLLKSLLARDLKERYTNTILGLAWLLIQPLFLLILYTFVFSEVLKIRFESTPSTAVFAFYLFAGLLVFNALAEVLTRAPTLLTERRELLLNTPLPAWILPLLPVGTSLVLEWLALLILCLGLAWWGDMLGWGLVLYVPYCLVRVILSLAAAYCLAILGVFLRDLRQIMPAVLSVLLFISPVLYPLERIPEHFKPLYDWNLFGQLVQGYRQALLEGIFVWQHWLGLLLIATLCLGASLWLFQRLMGKARLVL